MFLFYLSEDKSRGFGFVDFDLEEDCADALENMEGAELYGKVLRCSIAKPSKNLAPGKAVWSAEEWIQKSLADGEDEYIEEENLAPTS